MRSISAPISSPVVGATKSLVFSTSASRRWVLHGPVEAAAQELRALLRQLDRRVERAAHLVGRRPEREDLALLLVPGEIEHRRHVRQVGMLFERELHQDAHLLVRDPFRLDGLQRVPGHAATAVDLAALHRDVGLRRRLIAVDDAKSCAEQRIHDVRIDGVGARGATASHHHLVLPEISEGLDRRRMPDDADIDLVIGIADPRHLGRIELRLHAHQRIERQGAVAGRDRGAVLGRDALHVPHQPPAAGARHVLHDDVRIAWNVAPPMPRQHARVGVVGTAGGRADEDRDVPALEIVVGRRIGCAKMKERGRHAADGKRSPAPHRVSSLSEL